MALKLIERLGLEDTVEVADPFGMGIVYDIRHINCPEYKGHVEEKGEPPALRRLQAAARKAVFVAGAKARGDDKKAERFYEDEITRLISEIPDDELEFSEQDIEGIAKLIAGWRGDDEPFSYEAAVELLSAAEPIPVDIEAGEDDLSIKAGSPLGSSLAMYFHWHARQHELFRVEAMEAAEKNDPCPAPDAAAGQREAD